MKKRLGVLGSGQVVYDRPNSHLHGDIFGLVKTALSQITLTNETFAVCEVDFGRVIGESSCVKTSSADEIVYAQRAKRDFVSRFVKNRKLEPCTTLVVILKPDEGGGDYWVCVTAFIGRKAEMEPWDTKHTEETFQKSVEFWQDHALVWGSEKILPFTETRDEKKYFFKNF
jgi:hypothetical protein